MAISRALATTAARLTRQSRFVFTGTTEHGASSSLSFVVGDARTTMVRVDRIHRTTAELQSQDGQIVTVVSREEFVSRGERSHVFFTNPILYGETLAVQEIGHLEVPDDLDALHDLVRRTNEEMRDDELRAHLATADAVIVGRCIAVRPAFEEPVFPISEHDPEWWIATIQVARVLKGRLKAEVQVRYPNSRDIRWFRVPKPKEGEEAVFVLHRDELRHEVALALLVPDDVLRLQDADERRIAGLLERGKVNG